MALPRIGITLMILIPLGILYPVYSHAQKTKDMSRTSQTKRTRMKLEAGLEYMTPPDASRQIQTVSMNLLAGAEFFKKVRLSISGGVTTTYAWGNIIQWNEFFRDVKYKNAAFGAGPIFLLRFEPFVYNGLSFSSDISLGLIL